MRKILSLLTMMLSLVWVDANDITDPLFASTNGNEIT